MQVHRYCLPGTQVDLPADSVPTTLPASRVIYSSYGSCVKESIEGEKGEKQMTENGDKLDAADGDSEISRDKSMISDGVNPTLPEKW